MRLRMLLAYDGSNYSGWQVQSPAKAPNTIQGSLEKAFFKLTGQTVRVVASGRTDAGVHAFAQVAHVELSSLKPLHVDNWRHSLNSILPADIRILEIGSCSDNFHAGKDIAYKSYRYAFWQEEAFIPPFLFNQVWACGSLKLERMRMALPYLLGEHDFATFQNAGTPLRCTTRTIFQIFINEEKKSHFFPDHKPMLTLHVSASGFLKQMVRNIAGLLCYIGQERIDWKKVPEIMKAENRTALPSITAPARGLALVRVKYKGELS